MIVSPDRTEQEGEGEGEEEEEEENGKPKEISFFKKLVHVGYEVIQDIDPQIRMKFIYR